MSSRIFATYLALVGSFFAFFGRLNELFVRNFELVGSIFGVLAVKALLVT